MILLSMQLMGKQLHSYMRALGQSTDLHHSCSLSANPAAGLAMQGLRSPAGVEGPGQQKQSLACLTASSLSGGRMIFKSDAWVSKGASPFAETGAAAQWGACAY